MTVSNRELSLKVTGASLPAPAIRDGSNRGRFLVAAAGFVVYETLFIWLLGDRVYDYPYFSPMLWGWVALAAAGFFALGFFSRSWWSSLLLAAPLLVAFYFVYVVWTTNYPNGGSLTVNTNFPEIWLAYSAIFVPVWAAGVLIAKGRGRRSK